ncbi:type II secretion system minor pseudopilin GspK [Chitinimonas sp. BJYL2]|uniref:type II secretion system minor pseudopilin GspK n=1 Tax=Chitinimonas sp. BJYL2 TaxID=2976696 RepID=UPI0022B4A3ED|nr:type II secretion system minor pseudopilin GspK [Chitinimonas sp. BJYL2]
MKRLYPTQSGIAIVTAVAVAALVAALAGMIAFRHTLWLRQVENQQDLAQARNVANAAIDLSRLTLQADSRQNRIDHAQETWAIPIPNLPVEQGNAGGRILDVQGRFNLNNLIRNGAVSTTDLEAFQRLLGKAGLSPDLANAVLDWMDADSETRYPGGAEDREYLAQNPAYRTANRPLFDIGELAQIRGFTPDGLRRLQAELTALPVATPINVNFASADTLMAILPGLSDGDAAAIVRQRESRPYQSEGEFKAMLPDSIAGLATPERVGMESRYLLSEVDARFGRVTVSYRALLERNGDQVPRIVWIRRR